MLEFSKSGHEKIIFEGQDIFQALIKLRQKFEGGNWKLLCNGAREDVYPSGMSREMSGGRKAYITRLGYPAKKSDIVDIFDYAEPHLVTNTQRQEDFHRR